MDHDLVAQGEDLGVGLGDVGHGEAWQGREVWQGAGGEREESRAKPQSRKEEARRGRDGDGRGCGRDVAPNGRRRRSVQALIRLRLIFSI